MATVQKCSDCGAEIPSGALDGFCPSCLWRGLNTHLDEPEPTGDAPAPLPGLRIAGHDVFAELARGGMGIVYHARQREPGRDVALKMMLPHQLGSADLRGRFRAEARAAAALEHTAILPIYQVGEHEGMPWFTMKMASGGSLAQRLGEYRGRWREIAQLVATLADAVHFAHEHGILHRDLKPGNILFDDARRAYVSDFGLAKLASADVSTTRSLSTLGTPQYLAPEVAVRGAREATTAADIYSLGAVLYELLAGRPPFEADGMAALLKKIAEAEAEPPSRAARDFQTAASAASIQQSETPRDLEVICLKCLAKEPANRYATARELAEDLHRWLDGRPITARPVALLERTLAWAKRNPLTAQLAALLVIALTVGGTVLWRSNRNLATSLHETEMARRDERANFVQSLITQARAEGATTHMGRRFNALATLQHAGQLLSPGATNLAALREEAAAAMARTDLRLIARWPEPLATNSQRLAFTPDLAHYCASATDGGFELRATRTGRAARHFRDASGRPAESFDFNHDGSVVAVSFDDATLALWRLDADAPIRQLTGPEANPRTLAFHPDGQTLVLHTPRDGTFLQPLAGGEKQSIAPGEATALALGPIGTQLAIVRADSVELWDVATRTRKWSALVAAPTRRVAWHPAGESLLVVSRSDNAVLVFDAATGAVLTRYTGHATLPGHFEFHPGGQMVLSASRDGAVRLWDARTGRDLVATESPARSLRFSRDGKKLAAAAGSAELGLYEVAAGEVFREFTGGLLNQLRAGAFAATPDGNWLASGGNGSVRLWQTGTGSSFKRFNTGNRRHIHGIIAPDNTGFYFIRRAGPTFQLKVTTNATGIPAFSEPQPVGEPEKIWPLGLASTTDWLEEFSVNAGLRVAEFWPGRPPVDKVLAMARGEHHRLSPDLKWLAAAFAEERAVVIWNVRDGSEAARLDAGGDAFPFFSPDSRWLLTSGAGRHRLWETGFWKPIAVWPGPSGGDSLGEAAFSADGRRLALEQDQDSFLLLEIPALRQIARLRPPARLNTDRVLLDERGSRLWILGVGPRVFEWNLTALEKEFAALSLDRERKQASSEREKFLNLSPAAPEAVGR